MSIIQGTSKSSAATYEIDQSIRFNDNDTAYLDNTSYSGSPTSGTDCTFSFWVKRCNLSTTQCLFFGGDPNGSTWEIIRFESDNQFRVGQASSAYDLITSQAFVDPSAWSHFVVAFDTDNGTAADRIKIYHNGSRITDFSLETNPSSGYVTNFNTGGAGEFIRIGYQGGGSNPSDVYLAEINFVDGQALAPTDFGKTNSDTGQWVPVKYTGSYGVNGYYLKGQDSSALGDDSSGNGNDFTSSGLAAADQMSDSPTNNFCVMSPIDKSSAITTSDGNLTVTNSGTNSWNHGRGTLFAPSGKWYYEWTPTAGSYALAGWMTDVSGNDYVEEESDPDTTYYRGVGTGGRGVVIGGGSPDTGPANFSNGDVVMMAIDVDTMKFWVGVNGTWYNSGDPANGTNATGTWTARIGYKIAPWYGCFNGTSETFNFGQSSFSYTIPTGFNSWSTESLPDPTISNPGDYFQTVLYTGNNTDGHAITGLGFQPDWVWIKDRDTTASHAAFDAVRGVSGGNGFLCPNIGDSEGQGGATNTLISLDSDGFTLDDDSDDQRVNYAGGYVAWCWKANGSGSSNTDGDITSTVSANTTSGFSILTYSGNGSDNQTIGHGLGIAPKMIITKRRNASGSNQAFYINSSAAPVSNTEQYRATPTSSVYTIGVGGDINNSSGTYVAYVFAEVEGFSKIGSYEGNGSSTNGPFVYTGFKPRLVLFRRYDALEGWNMIDTARGSGNFGSAAGSTGTNPTAGNELNTKINVNDANAEEDNPTGSRKVSFLSNGFKVKTTNTAMNTSGGDYFYMAFAESPFKTATAR